MDLQIIIKQFQFGSFFKIKLSQWTEMVLQNLNSVKTTNNQFFIFKYQISRKRYSSCSQGNKYLIKTFLDKGSGGPYWEVEPELAFHRLMNCQMEKREKSYGMKDLLNMKKLEKGIHVDVNPRQAKYQIMGAISQQIPQIWINRQVEEKKLKKNFQFNWTFLE
ncbi:unnamed protein product [Paramecium octaurelia]|uniref:Uncharacterized protein n=1 Tax=Paramecium octaurelia TaxID=43137 RepID=A0A8S1WH08_PAROT|nr:unnamed protein product [Paramecium octaurelia]